MWKCLKVRIIKKELCQDDECSELNIYECRGIKKPPNLNQIALPGNSQTKMFKAIFCCKVQLVLVLTHFLFIEWFKYGKAASSTVHIRARPYRFYLICLWD